MDGGNHAGEERDALWPRADPEVTMSDEGRQSASQADQAGTRRDQVHVASTSFLALFSTVGLGFYGLSFFYDFMVADLGWSRGFVTSGNMVGKLVVGPAFGFLAGWIVDRFGPRRLMLAGLVVGGGGLVGLGAVPMLPFLHFFFYFFFVWNALGYVCGGPLPNQVLLSRWFDRGRGRAMGFAYTGIGLGGAVSPLLAHGLTERFGWQAALQTLGVLYVLIALPLAFFVKDSPEAARGAPRPPQAPIRPVLRKPAFYLLAIGSMCSIGAVGGTILNLKLFLVLDRGFSQAKVAQLLFLVLAASVVGRLIMGWAADRFTKKYVMVVIYLLVAAAVPILLLSTSGAALLVFAIVFGIGLGGDYMIIPLMGAELFGVRVLGRLMGVILTADGVAEAVGPWLVGYLRDVTGSYTAGFGLLVGLASVGAVVVAQLPRGRVIEDEA
jgi:MFS family permease